jgi:DnaK suppressor protein
MTLKKKELDSIKQRLMEMRGQIQNSLQGTAEEVKAPDEHSGYSQHQADQGTDDFGKTISIGVTSNEQDILRQINRALEKIDENSYGVCDITGEEIPPKRLEAVPYAIMTVKAQEMYERGELA